MRVIFWTFFSVVVFGACSWVKYDKGCAEWRTKRLALVDPAMTRDKCWELVNADFMCLDNSISFVPPGGRRPGGFCICEKAGIDQHLFLDGHCPKTSGGPPFEHWELDCGTKSDYFSLNGDCDIKDDCVSSKAEGDATCVITILTRNVVLSWQHYDGSPMDDPNYIWGESDHDHNYLQIMDNYLQTVNLRTYDFDYLGLPKTLKVGDKIMWSRRGTRTYVYGNRKNEFKLCFSGPKFESERKQWKKNSENTYGMRRSYSETNERLKKSNQALRAALEALN